MYLSQAPCARIHARGFHDPIPAKDVTGSDMVAGCGFDSYSVADMPWCDKEHGLQIVPATESRYPELDFPVTYTQAWSDINWGGIPQSIVLPPSEPIQEPSSVSVNGSDPNSATATGVGPSDKATEELGAQARLERRRAQNRVSQQAFRARKESHIKALERGLEAMNIEHDTLLKKYARRRAEIDRLKTRIAELGLEIDLVLGTQRYVEATANLSLNCVGDDV
ncbi:hypothetical protein AYO20_05938 [Fonsecaea nubica]|uniref:Putative transcription factor kapC n=1 Tax=Fonsecaea nubica TaxID=856822 RepID=A0A178D031_9EURO|nr:hypothetical protein AYO20_05938 [Fonsecaea nubica]OAL34743.1 hypothetical protein AYO20_05938 [Fonsecaea nubica]